MKLDDMERGLVALDDGIWVGDLPQAFFVGVQLKVRRLWNSDYAKLYGELTASAPRNEAGELVLSAEGEASISDECLKRTVLVDWEGIDDPCTEATVDKVFAKPALRPVFRSAIIWAASHAAETFTKGLEADATNYPTPWSGRCSGETKPSGPR